MNIEVKDLSFTYNPGTPFESVAIKNISFSVQKGEFVGIIGHTGSGKSTLIQHLNGLIKPTSGSILINGENILKDKQSLREARKKVGLVFQYPEHQLFEATVRQDVEFGPKTLKLPQDEIDRRVKAALNLVGITDDLFERSPFELSGGQKRRVAIAGVLAMEPEVLILDEPASGLDPKSRDEILSQLHDMQKKLGITVFLVSHSMEDIAKLADRLMILYKGELVRIGTPREIFMEPDYLRSIGLGAPMVCQLFEELRKANLGLDLPHVITVDEAEAALVSLLEGKHGQRS